MHAFSIRDACDVRVACYCFGIHVPVHVQENVEEKEENVGGSCVCGVCVCDVCVSYLQLLVGVSSSSYIYQHPNICVRALISMYSTNEINTLKVCSVSL